MGYEIKAFPFIYVNSLYRYRVFHFERKELKAILPKSTYWYIRSKAHNIDFALEDVSVFLANDIQVI